MVSSIPCTTPETDLFTSLVDDKLQRLLRHDRLLIACVLALVISASWLYLLMGAGMGMNGFEMTRHTLMKMDMMASAVWTPSYFALMFFMWWLMMVAMMLPSATPVILLATALNRRTEPGNTPFGSSSAFTLGYLLVWSVFSLMAVSLQWALQEADLLSNMLYITNPLLSALLFFVTGAWQFTPYKQSCLQHCRGPVDFLMRHRRPGNTGAIIMGVQHGLFCLGCCWFLMVLLFVGGVMNLFWVAGLAIYVWFEKILVAGEKLSRIMGIILISWGLWLAVHHWLA